MCVSELCCVSEVFGVYELRCVSEVCSVSEVRCTPSAVVLVTGENLLRVML